MKSLVSSIVVGVFLFIASAGASWLYINQTTEATPEDPATTAEVETGPDIELVDEASKQEVMPVSIRPDMPISIEVATELAQSMMQKEKAIFESEQRLKKEERRLKMLFEDLKQEQEKLMSLQAKIEAKILEAREAVKLLKLEKDSLQEKSDALSILEKKTGTKSENADDELLAQRVRKVKNWFRDLDDAQAASYLKEFADQGEIEFVGKLLDSFEPHKAAKILTQLDNPPLVAQIINSFSIPSVESKQKTNFR